VNPAAELVIGDVRDTLAVLEAARDVEVVVHAAALGGDILSSSEPAEFHSHNVHGTATLLDVLARSRLPIRSLVVTGTVGVYGEDRHHCPRHGIVDPAPRSLEQLERGDWPVRCPTCDAAMQPLPTPEDRAPRGATYEAKTKRDQEEMCLLFGQIYGIRTVALRLAEVYGPRQARGGSHAGPPARFLDHLLRGLPPHLAEDGGQTRDFVSVRDVAAAVARAAEGQLPEGAYNVGTGRRTSMLELALRLAAITGRDLPPRLLHDPRTGEVRHAVPDVARLSAAGCRAGVDLDDGLRELVAGWEPAG
jgi:dTDP-L-rhamnose 4-epimerase